jgi:hypothetical protein
VVIRRLSKGKKWREREAGGREAWGGGERERGRERETGEGREREGREEI